MGGLTSPTAPGNPKAGAMAARAYCGRPAAHAIMHHNASIVLSASVAAALYSDDVPTAAFRRLRALPDSTALDDG